MRTIAAPRTMSSEVTLAVVVDAASALAEAAETAEFGMVVSFVASRVAIAPGLFNVL